MVNEKKITLSLFGTFLRNSSIFNLSFSTQTSNSQEDDEQTLFVTSLAMLESVVDVNKADESTLFYLEAIKRHLEIVKLL